MRTQIPLSYHGQDLNNRLLVVWYWNSSSLQELLFRSLLLTVGARIPNKFGIRMVNSCSVLVPTIWKPNLASLDHFIHKEKIYFLYKTKTEPFENRILKRFVFEWIRNSNVRYSSPHCIVFFQPLNHISSLCWVPFPTKIIRWIPSFFRWRTKPEFF